MKGAWLAILLVVVFPARAACESCETMVEQLARLRKAYHSHATGGDAQRKSLTFDELVAKLDEVIELKKKMGDAGCGVPPRSKRFEADQYAGMKTAHDKKRRRGKRSR